MLLIKVLLILSLLLIFYQDLKERQVYWFLFPIAAFFFGVLYYTNTIKTLFFLSVVTNLMFVGVLVLVIYLYARYKLKLGIFNVFGLGDLLLFIGLAFTFSSVSFLVLFVCALIFSLLLHISIKRSNATVPLAGYMSLFFGITYIAQWMGFINNLYSL